MKIETLYNVGDTVYVCEWNNLIRKYIYTEQKIKEINIRIYDNEKLYISYGDSYGNRLHSSQIFKTEELAKQEVERLNIDMEVYP